MSLSPFFNGDPVVTRDVLIEQAQTPELVKESRHSLAPISSNTIQADSMQRPPFLWIHRGRPRLARRA
jgi:hypothetical protein